MRNIKISPDFCAGAYGSVLFEMGNTKLICAASVGKDVPDHAESRGAGWLTANYTMLPYSTSPRKDRPLMRQDGRSVEIQRLIGRSLRSVIDLEKIKGRVITLDCDVLQADGGTRTAAITGACIALRLAVERMIKEEMIQEYPLNGSVAAVSVGLVDDEILLDLDYSEDSRASVDMNVVMKDSLDLVEIQGTGEKSTFSREQLDAMMDLAGEGISELIKIQTGV